jgi:agmatinase
MTDFDPNGAAEADSGIFGFNYSEEDSNLVVLPVPWEATCSYRDGCSEAPSLVIDASKFVELFDLELGNFYEYGIFGKEIDNTLLELSQSTAALVRNLIAELEGSKPGDNKTIQQINANCSIMRQFVYDQVLKTIGQGKISGVLGGDHSVAQGSIEAHLKKYPDMGVLQIDAHSDLRDSFEGLAYSHASVMYNVMNQTNLTQLVQVGVRGYCEEEHNRVINSEGKIKPFFDTEINRRISMGDPWNAICLEIVESLPDEIYLSFDIDGLEQSNCPNTGTPVPGGLSYNQALHLLETISKAGKKIIGFDLVEVSCDEKGAESWDAIMAAHLLYKLCGYSLTSN